MNVKSLLRKVLKPALVLLLIGCGRNINARTEAPAPPSDASVNIFAMNTVITIEAHGGDAGNAVNEAQRLIQRLESLWSVTDETSEIYRVNHSQGEPAAVSAETNQLLDFALTVAEATGGDLDPTIYPVLRAWGFTTGEYHVPGADELAALTAGVDYRKVYLNDGQLLIPDGMELDLGAVAKGYAGDLLTERLREYGVTSAIINLGGNVSLIGRSPRGERWRVGIRNPHGDGNVGVLTAEDTNIITSGGYERYFTGTDGTTYGHIINPASGQPVDNDLLSVTIVGNEGRMCDALSTALYVKGLSGAIDYWQAQGGFDMILITKSNEIYLTEDLGGSFRLTESGQGVPVHLLIHNQKEAIQ